MTQMTVMIAFGGIHLAGPCGSHWAEMAVQNCPGEHWADLSELVVLSRAKSVSVPPITHSPILRPRHTVLGPRVAEPGAVRPGWQGLLSLLAAAWSLTAVDGACQMRPRCSEGGQSWPGPGPGPSRAGSRDTSAPECRDSSAGGGRARPAGSNSKAPSSPC